MGTMYQYLYLHKIFKYYNFYIDYAFLLYPGYQYQHFTYGVLSFSMVEFNPLYKYAYP